MQRRVFFLGGLTAALGPSATSALARVGHDMRPAAAVPDVAETAQYGGPPRRGRRHRCRLVQRRVLFRDRFGRLRERVVEREICH